MEKKKLTSLEKQWILYDVGNSAFILLVSTILPIYFNSLCDAAGIAEVDYLAYWGYAASVCTLIVALSGPVLGTIADNQGYKKKMHRFQKNTICMSRHSNLDLSKNVFCDTMVCGKMRNEERDKRWLLHY